MANVRIAVGAFAQGNLGTVFDTFIASARKAQTQVRREMVGTSAVTRREAERGARDAAKANEQLTRQFAKADADRLRSEQRASDERVRIQKREWDAKLRESIRARAAEERDILKTAERANRAEQREREKVIRGRRETVGRVGSAIVGVARQGAGMAMEGMAAMGLDTSMSSLIGKNVNLSAMATKITNSGMFAQGKTATIKDVQETEDAIRKAAHSTSQDYAGMASALDAFVGATGDLDSGKATLEELGKIANATGTPLEDLGMLAGKLNKDLGNVPNKADRVTEVLRNLALQGSLGNVELEDLAKFGGRVSANAYMFAGDRNQTISQLGAMAQISMQGGRVNAAEATNAVARFASQMGNENVQKNVRSVMGRDYEFYTDSSHSKMKTPEQLITELVSGANGDQDKLAAMFKNVMSKSVIEGFTAEYTDAGGGEKGIARIHELFQKFSKPLTNEQVASANKLTMESDAGKIRAANNDLADSARKLVPVLQSLVPAFVKVTEFISNNLGSTIALAIGGSIMKAALGDVVKNALTSALGGGGGATAAAGGGGMGALGAAGLVLTIAAATLAIGVAQIDANVAKLEKTGEKRVGEGLEGTNTAGDAQALAHRRGRFSAADFEESAKLRASLDQQIQTLQTRISAGEEWNNTAWYNRPLGIGFGGMSDHDTMAQDAGNNIDSLKEQLGMAQGARSAIATRTVLDSIASLQSTYESLRAQFTGGSGKTGASGIDQGAKALTEAAATFKAAGFEGAAAALTNSAGLLSSAAAAIGASGGGGGADPKGRH